MSVAKVLRLEDYRGKRAQRLRISERLYSADPGRLAIFRSLREVSELCDADRVATVWVDEYGPGSVHPHVVLDYSADRPRRSFPAELLHRAWDLGVPGAIDDARGAESSIPATFAISLGSDGMRAWFLVAESSKGRVLLPSVVRDRLMFAAGECAAVLLHRELETMLPLEGQTPEGGFPGWAVLQDLEGRESDEVEGRRIAQRFVVARVARMFADDDLVCSTERISEQVRRARLELPGREECSDDEPTLWHCTLDHLEAGDLEALADVLVRLGELAERQQHTHGALELYDCAYGVARAVALPRVAAEAAWFSGRLLRRRASWDEAREQYLTARRIADVAGLEDISVHVLVGLALMRRDQGNIPAARADLDEALAMAEKCGNRDAVAVVHHSYLGLEQVAGNLGKALEHGWIAVATYESEERRTQCMAGLAAALVEYGDRSAAEDAWTLVAHTSGDKHYTIYAHDALSYLAALRGDASAFDWHVARCEALNWESSAPSLKAEVLQYRGFSHRALGNPEAAEIWLRRAIAFAEEHGFNRVLFESEAALESLSASRAGPDEAYAYSAAPADLREGLRTMRRELVGVGV